MIPPRHVRFGFAATVLVFSVTVLTGCGGARLEGKVTFNGEPVDGGTISLIPEGGGPGQRNVPGQINDGKYSLGASRSIESGTYRVEIYWHKKTGKQIPSSDPPNKVDETIQVIPKKYNTESKTTIEITSGTITKDFDLTSK
jgi:hypothetical protein